MGKRRIYEIAKELGIDSKDLVVKLQAIGIEVKSHSSTVDDDDLKRALAKPADKKPEVKRPGFVVRKKADIPVAPVVEAADNAAEDIMDAHAAHEQQGHDAHGQAQYDERTAADDQHTTSRAQSARGDEDRGNAGHTQDAHAASAHTHSATSPALESEPGLTEKHVESEHDLQQVVASSSSPAFPPKHVLTEGAPDASASQAPLSAQANAPATASATPSGAAASAPAATPSAPVDTRPLGQQRPPTVLPPIGGPGSASASPVGPGGPIPAGAATSASTPGARVVRMIDRDKLISRIPPRRLPPSMGGPRPGPSSGGWRPGGPPGAPRPGMGGAPARTGPGGLRPGPGSLEPQMNGPMRYGQVKEIRVVTDAYGKGKEMVDVAKERAKKGPATDEKRPRLDKRSLMLQDRAFTPSRLKRRRGLRRASVSTTASTMKASKRVVRMDDTITTAALASELSVKVSDVIRKLMELGVMATINQPLDFETATLVCQAYDFTVTSEAYDEDEYIDADDEEVGEGEEGDKKMLARPPVVTIMGHVDHGKTSLLDAIRGADVAAGEAGGITQHIGAYQVDTPKGKITFLDTPGHEAFTAMRARGAKVTDLVVLVVAADDGPMPQTVEAIRHAQAAGVPIIVAVNKMDKPGSKPDQIMQALTEYKLVPEEWGGDTMYVKTSALKKTGISELLDAILLQSEVLELDANPARMAKGTVVEARLDKGFGPRVSLIVQDGTLKVGDIVVAGVFAGKVRSMLDDKGAQIKEALPSTPVEIMGLEGVPNAGDTLNAVEDMDAANTVAAHRREIDRNAGLKAKAPKVSMEDIMAKLKGTGPSKEFKCIVKADVQGSVEALRESLLKLSTNEVTLNIIHSAVGSVSEGDVMLASASGASIIAFNTKADGKTKATAQQEGIEIRSYSIIYNVLDDVRKAMGGLLAPITSEKVLGRAQIRQIFSAGKVGNVAGCSVTDGKMVRAARVRVLRDGKKVFEGKMSSLKRFKDDAREVASGFECGIMFEGYNEMKIDDVIEAFEMTETARSLDNPPPTRTPNRPTGAQAAQ